MVWCWPRLDHHSRQQHVGLAEDLRLQIGDDRELGRIVLAVPHDLLEQIVCDLDLGEIEIEQIGADSPLFIALVLG